ncbi:MAG: Nif3-like dinuclear metal center hexameric protein, partial [Megasphaera sp.]
YSDCSFTVKGEGRFKPHEGTNPFIGSVGKVETVAEERIETIVPESLLNQVLPAMVKAHPYEEPAYDIYPLKNAVHSFTMGRVGNWPTPEPAAAVLRKIKDILHRDALSYAGDTDVTVRRVALLGGGGAGFINLAKQAGADLYLTGDMKYHDAQEAFKQGIVVVDGGHFGTESPVVDDLCRRLIEASAEHHWDIDCQRDPTSRDMIQSLI